jgi:hypothetical protein
VVKLVISAIIQPSCQVKGTHRSRVAILSKLNAHPYKRDLENIDFHLLDTGHFALEEDYEFIAELISNFLRRIRSMQAQGVA